MRVKTIVPSVVLKVLKIILTIAIWILYWKICEGEFLGNSESNTKIIASVTFLAFIIYNLTILTFYVLGKAHEKIILTDLVLNIFGGLLYIIIGALNIGYRILYQMEHEFDEMNGKKFTGVVVGMLLIFTGMIYLMDSMISCVFWRSKRNYEDDYY